MRKKIGRKYGNIITVVDDKKFDSKREAARYFDLNILAKSGAISHLVLQPEFLITINGQKICKYIADFAYINEHGDKVFEDVKGMKTPVYRLKKKLVEASYGISITEIM